MEDKASDTEEEGNVRAKSVYEVCVLMLSPFPGVQTGKGDFILERRGKMDNSAGVERYYTIDIIVTDRESAYSKVNELLHEYSDIIKLRVGYPVPDANIAIVFLIVKTTNDRMGAFTGKLGKISGVKVKSIAI